jgi:hypothetical protein
MICMKKECQMVKEMARFLFCSPEFNLFLHFRQLFESLPTSLKASAINDYNDGDDAKDISGAIEHALGVRATARKVSRAADEQRAKCVCTTSF